MEKRLATAEEIRSFVQNLVNENQEIKDDGLQVEIGDVSWNEPDAEGCNWDIRFFRNARGHIDVIRSAMHEAKQRFQLKT